MREILNHKIKLTEKLDRKDYEDISSLQKLCLEVDKTALKLELDYKLSRVAENGEKTNNINEFMYYDGNTLIGYIGIGDYGGDTIEVNGMVHPEYRRKGIFRRLFSLVKAEWEKRKSTTMLLLSDNKSISGLEFIKSTDAKYHNSEYEMVLKADGKIDLSLKNLTLRKANNNDAKEIAEHDYICFGRERKEEEIYMPEEEEKFGSITYIAEIEDKAIGKVRIEVIDGIGGIYGLAVLPEYRRKGYGREILTQAVEMLKEGNPKSIMLQVVVINENALNLYKSCGFEETYTMDYYELIKR